MQSFEIIYIFEICQILRYLFVKHLSIKYLDVSFFKIWLIYFYCNID